MRCRYIVLCDAYSQNPVVVFKWDPTVAALVEHQQLIEFDSKSEPTDVEAFQMAGEPCETQLNPNGPASVGCHYELPWPLHSSPRPITIKHGREAL